MFSIIINLLISIILMLIALILILAVYYFVIKLATKRARKDDMSKIDFSKDKEYYREILEKYTPAELSYIDDFKVDYKREIVSTIMNLELKRIIEIKNGKIEIINSNKENLRKTEKYILENIIDGKVKIGNSGYIELYAQREALEDGLIKENTKEEIKKRIIKMILKWGLVLILVIGIFIITSYFYRSQSNEFIQIITLITIILFWGLIMLVPIFLIVYSIMQYNSYSRTENGENVNKKLEGLKLYIENYSLLKEKDKQYLQIWEEYFIYSVILGINQDHNMIERIMKLVEIDLEQGKIYYSRPN